MKIVINACFGGFSISPDAARFMAERGSKTAKAELQEWEKGRRFFGYGYVEGGDGYKRDDPLLVEAVETLGEKACGSCAKLVVVEIPDGIDWEIEEYDGSEYIAEKHRTWS
jgi:hypothetical protein